MLAAMKLRWHRARRSAPLISAALLSLSCAALAWHTEDAMKKTAGGLPSSAPEVKGAAKRSGSSDKRRAGANSAVKYGVERLIGGIDRVILTKRDDTRNLCIQVTLASPGIAELEVPAGKVDLPPNWMLERAILVRDAAACDSPLRRWPEGAVGATGVSGSVRWEGEPTERTTVDLTLTFSARGSKPALTERLAFKR